MVNLSYGKFTIKINVSSFFSTKEIHCTTVYFCGEIGESIKLFFKLHQFIYQLYKLQISSAKSSQLPRINPLCVVDSSILYIG